MTAAQRQYIAAIRTEIDERKKASDGPAMSRDEWQQIADSQSSKGRPQTLQDVA